jgi:mycofactocin system glycosyltransferase
MTGTSAADLLVVVDDRVRLWRDGRSALGGAPWGVVRLGPASADLLLRLRGAGHAGLAIATPTEQAAAERLVDRGLAHPMPPSALDSPSTLNGGGSSVASVEVVVPAYGRSELLSVCLHALGALSVTVVDDGTPTDAVAEVARSHGARLIRHEVNRGPAAARNTGLAATTAEVVAFVDADCAPEPGWLEPLLALFSDPRVGAVAPRVVSRLASRSLLARHEHARSSLDMGDVRAIVRPGGRLGYLPSATLLVRRKAFPADGFDEGMRLGEDVDLVWRLSDAGWHVRYEPSVKVDHAMRLHPGAWLKRRYQYGTSAAALEHRHPGRLAPARLSGWNVAAVVAFVAKKHFLGTAFAGAAAALLARELSRVSVDRAIAPVVVGMGLSADTLAVGHALRREWWPIGWLAMACCGRSRVAKAAAASMLVPLAWEWLTTRPDVDPARYAALRLVEDAAYGSGVIVSAVTARSGASLRPVIRLPYLDRRLIGASGGRRARRA